MKYYVSVILAICFSCLGVLPVYAGGSRNCSNGDTYQIHAINNKTYTLQISNIQYRFINGSLMLGNGGFKMASAFDLTMTDESGAQIWQNSYSAPEVFTESYQAKKNMPVLDGLIVVTIDLPYAGYNIGISAAYRTPSNYSQIAYEAFTCNTKREDPSFGLGGMGRFF